MLVSLSIEEFCSLNSRASPVQILYGSRGLYSADTAVQPSHCEVYRLHLFLAPLASLSRVCGTCNDANSSTINTVCLQPPLAFMRTRFRVATKGFNSNDNKKSHLFYFSIFTFCVLLLFGYSSMLNTFTLIYKTLLVH